MKTTSLELSKKLYEAFPEWKDVGLWWWKDLRVYDAYEVNGKKYPERQVGSGEYELNEYGENELFKPSEQDYFPAYNTDYLLEKLESVYPQVFREEAGVISEKAIWVADLKGGDGLTLSTGDAPLEALGNLALALKEKGLL